VPEAELPPIPEAAANPGRTVSGVQRKLLVVKTNGGFTPASKTGAAPYIAKFNSERIDSLVRNEGLSLKWSAALLGDEEVNTFTFGEVSKINEYGLIVARFDRTPDGKKLRLEDFTQILLKPRGQDLRALPLEAWPTVKLNSARLLGGAMLVKIALQSRPRGEGG
jgi:serine/threonine-protein kinase HipA